MRQDAFLFTSERGRLGGSDGMKGVLPSLPSRKITVALLARFQFPGGYLRLKRILLRAPPPPLMIISRDSLS